MSWINTLRLSLLIGFITLLALSWYLRSFQFQLLASVVIMITITIFFSKLRNITVPVTSIAIVLAVAELVVPIFLPNAQALTEYDTSTSYASGGYRQRINGFGYRPTPGVHTSRKLTSSGEIIYDVVYTIGEDGYRHDFDAERYDAYIYGGSFTFGEGLNDDETLSYYLNELYGIKAKNVGAHGYGLHQALYNISHGVTSSEPNSVNILLTAPWHALRSACKPSYSAGTPRYIFNNDELELDGVCSGGSFLGRVLSKSNIFSLVTLAMSNGKNTVTDTDIELYIEIIRAITELSVENDASVVIAYIRPTDEQISATRWTNEGLIAELSNIALVVDVTLAESREDLDPQFFIHRLDQHPSALANQRRAEILHSIFD